MSPLDRVEQFVWALMQVVLYVVIVFVGIAFVTKPYEMARLTFGERVLQFVTKVLEPVSDAMGRTAWGRRVLEVADEISRRADALVEKALGRR